MPEVELDEEQSSRLEDIKYYTSLFLGTVAINALFAFLFLIPFVLDPAISTMMHDFVEKPVHCKVDKVRYRVSGSMVWGVWQFIHPAPSILRPSLAGAIPMAQELPSRSLPLRFDACAPTSPEIIF